MKPLVASSVASSTRDCGHHIAAEVQSLLTFHVYHIKPSKEMSNSPERCERLPRKRKIGHCSKIPAAGCRPFRESIIEALFLCMRLRVYAPKNMVQRHGTRKRKTTVEVERMAMTFELARMTTRRSRMCRQTSCRLFTMIVSRTRTYC